jgi:sporulation and cell division protein SsgA
VTAIHPAGREAHRHNACKGIPTQQIKIGPTMSSSTVSAELGVLLAASQQVMVPLAASLFYTAEDPYAVRFTLHAGLDEPVEWIFARDLLSAGSGRREGPGDVTVWPSDDSAGSVLNIELSTTFGELRLEASASMVSDFLRRTYQIVPAGQESEHIDMDSGLNDLLRQAS